MYKTLLAVLGGSVADEGALQAACTAAGVFSAHVQCVRIRPGPVQIAMAGVTDLSGVVTPELFDALQQEDRDRTARARETFEQFRTRFSFPVANAPNGATGPTIEWRERIGDSVDEAIAEGRIQDLIIIGSQRDARSLSAHQMGSVVLGVGRPVLLAPAARQAKSFSTIAIAWKPTAEAARAISAAMPFLEQSSRILLLSAAEDGHSAERARDSAAALQRQLLWHKLSAELHILSSSGTDTPRAITGAARDMGAELLVMGGYGHTRLRETVFGGFTRHVLHDTELPTLLFH